MLLDSMLEIESSSIEFIHFRKTVEEAHRDVENGLSYGFIYFPPSFTEDMSQLLMAKSIGGLLNQEQSTPAQVVIGLDYSNFQVAKTLQYTISKSSFTVFEQVKETCPWIAADMGFHPGFF